MFKITQDYLRTVFFLMAIKDLCLKHVHDLENNNLIILEVIQNSSDNFRELIQNNTKHLFSEFIANNTETFSVILLHNTVFVRIHIKQ